MNLLTSTSQSMHGSSGLGERRQRMYNFLREHPVGVLSSVDPKGDPHGAVIYFAVDERLAVRFLTKKRTRKYDNLVHHRHVMLTVFDQRSQTTVQVRGFAVEREGQRATNAVAHSLFNAALATSDSGLPPIAKLQAGAFTTFAIDPVQVRMAIYGRPEVGDYDQLFESVESFELEQQE